MDFLDEMLEFLLFRNGVDELRLVGRGPVNDLIGVCDVTVEYLVGYLQSQV